jgi:Ser/Thr protein kinase RdoA (MazF antagonist)
MQDQQVFISEVSHDWNLIHFPDLRCYLEHLDPAHKGNAERVIHDFEDHVTPLIPSLRQSVIHSDLNGLNIVLKDKVSIDGGYHVAGFIDFNDSVETCVIFELGISLAYIMMENLHPITCSSVVEFVGPMIGAYHSVLPLSAEEVDVLYYLVLARCCQVAINSMRSFAAEPWNLYLTNWTDKGWRLVDYLLSVPKSYVDRTWLQYISGDC